MNTKVTTVIMNATKQRLTIKVGNRHCYARLTSVKQGAEYRMHMDVNWTYREFLLQDKNNAARQLFLSSDDCCENQRITIMESSDGKLTIQTQLRNHFGREPCSAIVEEEQESSAAAPDQKLNYYSNVMRCWKAWLCKFL